VRVVMTRGGTQFITPLTMQTLSSHPVARSLFDPRGGPDRAHPSGRRGRPDHRRAGDGRRRSRGSRAAWRRPAAAWCWPRARPCLLAPAMNVNMWRTAHAGQPGRLLGPRRGGPLPDRGPDQGPLGLGGRRRAPHEPQEILARRRGCCSVRAISPAGASSSPRVPRRSRSTTCASWQPLVGEDGASRRRRRRRRAAPP